MYCATLYLFFIEMMPGRIGQIGWKSIEITLYACLVELGGNLLRLHCMPAGRIRPVKLGGNPLRLHCMPAWSNWVEIY